VGVTQWRVRDGVFLSTVMPAYSSQDVLGYLNEVPEDWIERWNIGFSRRSPTPLRRL